MPDSHLDTGTLIRKRDTLFETARSERGFLLLVGAAIIASAAATPYPDVSRWVGFLLAAYSTVANDSIQTVGTFIASNEHRRWWVLWAFIGGAFLVVFTWGWLANGGGLTTAGDVSYGRDYTTIGLVISTALAFAFAANSVFREMVERQWAKLVGG